MAKKSDTIGADLERLTQSQVAWLVNRQTPWLRDHAHLVLRNPDGTYDGRKLFAASPAILRAAELSADDIEQALRGEEYLKDRDELTAAALIVFFNKVEQAHGVPGLVAVLNVWRREWAALSKAMGPPAPRESEADIRARFARECEEAIADRRRDLSTEPLLYEITQCSECHRFRWGPEWHTENPKPHFTVVKSVCWACFGK